MALYLRRLLARWRYSRRVTELLHSRGSELSEGDEEAVKEALVQILWQDLFGNTLEVASDTPETMWRKG